MSQPKSSDKYNKIPYYAQDVDFDDLARRDPEWAVICKTAKASKWIDFHDPKIVLYAKSCPSYHLETNSRIDN